MLHRLRRVRLPPSLEGYGPGRPRSTAAALASSPTPVSLPTQTDGSEQAQAPSPSLSSTSPSPSSPSSPHADPSDPQPQARQKMPLGSDRRDAAEPTSAGPSTSSGSDSPETTATPARPRRPPTMVHAALAQPSPPAPRALLSLARTYPHTFTPDTASALTAYALRRGDTRAARGANDLLSTLRLPTPRVAIKHDERVAGLVERWRGIAGVEPNIMLLKRHPPGEGPAKAEGQNGEDVWKLLGRLHYLYLAGHRVLLDAAIGMVRAAGGKPKHEHELVYLHLAYSSEHPLAVLDAAAQLSSAYWSRQTLHLAVLSLLRHLRSSSEPVDPEHALSEIRTLLLRFEHPDRLRRRTPGPETWRHIAQYALESDHEQLAHLAFLGAQDAMAGDRARSAERAAEHAAERRKADADAVAGVKTETALDLQVGQDAPALAPPTPKFPHHGKHLKRWEYLLHALRVRGWVVRPAAGEAVVDVADGVPTLMQRWVWVGREGEAAVREQEAASQAQVETEAADKGPENEAHAPQSDLDLLTRHAAEVQPEEKAHKLGKKAWRRSKSLARTAGKDTGADKTGHDETEE